MVFKTTLRLRSNSRSLRFGLSLNPQNTHPSRANKSTMGYQLAVGTKIYANSFKVNMNVNGSGEEKNKGLMQAHGVKRRRRHSKGGGSGKKSPRIRAQQPTAAVPDCKLAAPVSGMALRNLQLPDVPVHQRGICACDAMAWVVLVSLLLVAPL